MPRDTTPSRPDAPAAGGASPADGASGAPGAPRRGFLRRHRIVVAFAALVAVVSASAGGYLYYLNHTIGTIDRSDFTVGLPDDQRPAKIDNEAVNILMAGVDNGNGRDVSDLLEDGWKPGVFRSDTVMLMHVTADREDAYLVSIPRDAYVKIFNGNGKFQEKNKINTALSTYGPGAYVSTVEHLTGLRMDHQAIVDWAGFKDISEALGGVEVYIPETFYDTSQRRTWIEGRQNLEGDDALAYVRTRYNLPDNSGDFGRIARQQNFLRSMMGEMLSQGTMANPLKLTNTLKAVVEYVTVDDDFSTGEIRTLAMSLRGLQTEDVTFVTAPWKGYGNEVGSTVHLDEKQGDALWQAMADDNIADYLKKYGNRSGVLEGPKGVS
ncbi:MAG TPA: LCP family protein [Nocardioidaceae bacterium]|jgi:LCP family protein required for cell wall assembly|nr:LCP family protein [Nocardioidaceae bacterium]